MLREYLETYDPPMPVLDVLLSPPDDGQWSGPFVAIVDSGADFTIIPRQVLVPLDLPLIGPARMVSQWQDRRQVNLYQLDIQIGEIILSGVTVAGDPHSNEIILGRNVLNRLNLHLNGPFLQLELHVLRRQL